jgi:IS5 family transposase
VVRRITGELAGIAEQTMGAATAVMRNAKRALRTATGQRKGRLQRAINYLDTVGRTQRVVAQARSRLAGVMPESAHRLVSLHDADARPIRKGRLGKPVEFGYKAQIVDTPMGSSSTTTSRSETPLTHRNWPRRSSGSPAAPDTHRAR